MTGRRLGLLAAIVPVYVLLAWVSRDLGEFDALSVWYAPAGLALTAYILVGPTAFPALAIGEFVGGIVVFHVDSKFSILQMLVNAGGYAATYALVGLWLRRRGLIARVDTIRDAVPLIIAGILVAPACAALFGVGMQEWAGFVGDSTYWRAVSIWWVGDAIGIATITPALLVLGLVTGLGAPKMLPPALRAVPGRRFLAELAFPSAVAALVFLVSSGNPGLVGLVFAPVALIGLRYGVAGTALSMALLSPVVTVLANHRVGEVVGARTELQTLLLAIMAVGYVLGLVVDERSRLGQYHQELGEIIEATTDFVTVVRRDGSVRYVNPAGRQALGLAPDEALNDVAEESLYPAGTSAQLATEARSTAERTGSWHGEVLLQGRDGDVIAASKVVVAHYDKSGQPLRTTSVLRDVTEQRRLQEQLERRALYDDLTALPNRTLFLAQLDRAAHLYRMQQSPASALIVMLDGDDRSLGGLALSARDEVLREVGSRLLSAAGAGAVVARIDGLCFGVLPAMALPEPEAVRLGRHLADAVHKPLTVAGGSVALTASVGIAELRPDVPAAEILRAGSVAAHRAQALGGNRVVCHVESMTQEAQSALRRDALLRDVVDKNAFSLVYQNVYDTHSGRPVAVEALVRFVEEESPYPIIVLAERNGLIVPLGREILRRACGEFAAWRRPGIDLTLHVNASACQIAAASFCGDVRAALQESGIRPEQLTIEVTESAVSDPAGAAPVLVELHDMGVKIALDDFGTGYSSLAIIAQLPIDEVKLDQSFTQALTTSARTEALVGATISLAHQIGLAVVAEGVEEPEQLRLLSRMGCERVQGYLVGRPAPLASIALSPARRPAHEWASAGGHAVRAMSTKRE